MIFGGGGPSGLKNDVWVLSNANGTEPTPPAWTELNPTPPLPAERAFPTGVYDSTNNRMTIFRGSDAAQSFNDVWVLANANGVPTVEEGINDIAQNVADLVAATILNSGNGNALTSKLDNALKSLDKGKDIAAVNQLLAFINQVQALMNGNKPKLTAAEGQPLIDAATAVVDQILGGG